MSCWHGTGSSLPHHRASLAWLGWLAWLRWDLPMPLASLPTSTQPDECSIACMTGIGQTTLLPATLQLVAVAKRGVINSGH